MEAATSAAKATRIGPDSHSISRGVIGVAFDGRSKEGNFLRRLEAELLSQLGGEPTETTY